MYTQHEMTGEIYKDGKRLGRWKVVDELNTLRCEADAWKQETEKLAAHGERCRSLLDEALPNHGMEADHALICELSDVLEEQSPETSLARLIAKKQAEVLYEFTHGSYIMPATLNLAMSNRAKELRRQAEGKDDG